MINIEEEINRVFQEGKNGKIPDAEMAVYMDILRRVLISFDPKNNATAHGIKMFLASFRENLERKVDGKVLTKISSQEGKEAMVNFLRASLEYNICVDLLALADRKQAVAAENAKLLVLEHENFDQNVDWKFDPIKLLVIETSDDAEKLPIKKFCNFIKALADGSAPISIESVCEGNLPDEIKEALDRICGFKLDHFLRDIAELMIENGEDVKDLIVRICEDLELASVMAKKEELPGPLRFLAKIVLKNFN